MKRKPKMPDSLWFFRFAFFNMRLNERYGMEMEDTTMLFRWVMHAEG